MVSFKVLNVFWQLTGNSIPVCLVRGSKNALLDTGPPQQEKNYLVEELAKEGLAPEDIDFALLTHVHNDHTGGNAMLRATGKTRFMTHEADA